MKTADELVREAAIWLPILIGALEDEEYETSEIIISIGVVDKEGERRDVGHRKLIDFVAEIKEYVK